MFRIYKELLKESTKRPRNRNWTKDLTGNFSRGNTQMANKHIKRCSVSLVVREMHIGSTMRYRFILARML